MIESPRVETSEYIDEWVIPQTICPNCNKTTVVQNIERNIAIGDDFWIECRAQCSNCLFLYKTQFKR